VGGIQRIGVRIDLREWTTRQQRRAVITMAGHAPFPVL
jgi:hypothetical protein